MGLNSGSGMVGPAPSMTNAITLIDQLARTKQRAKELEAHIEKLEARGVRDEIDSMVCPGDLILRRVENGYIIREAPSSQFKPKTWLVEGDMPEAIKQLTAIHATKVMEKVPQRELFVDALNPRFIRDFSVSSHSNPHSFYPTSAEFYETVTGKKPFV